MIYEPVTFTFNIENQTLIPDPDLVFECSGSEDRIPAQKNKAEEITVNESREFKLDFVNKNLPLRLQVVQLDDGFTIQVIDTGKWAQTETGDILAFTHTYKDSQATISIPGSTTIPEIGVVIVGTVETPGPPAK